MKVKLFPTSTMATYNQKKEELVEELDDNMNARYESGMSYEDFETEYDEFVRYYYNTHPMSQYEINAIVENDLQIYLKIDQVAREYWCELTGDVYDKSGMENIVPLWRLAIADEWKNEYLEGLYEHLTNPHHEDDEDEDGEIPQPPPPPPPPPPQDPLTIQQ